MSRPDTRLVQPPRIPGEPARATSTPLYQTATFAQDLEGGRNPWDYSRSGNPTRDVLEEQLAALDGAERALAYGSGIAAVSAALRLAGPGDEVIVGDDLYGGTVRLLRDYERHLGLGVRRVDVRDPLRVRDALGPRTRLVFVETPTNPRLRVVDVAGLADVLQEHPAQLVVDNSMLSPLRQRPLELGADIALQSATKLLGGHGDLTAGVIAVSDGAVAERLAFLRNAEGSALAPFEAWLLLRGMSTLSVRLERQERNAAALADWLETRPEVTRVHRVPAGTGGVVVSFETGSVARSREIIRRARLFRTTVSFGGVTSSIGLPCAMSHASVSEAERATSGLAEDLVRISTGLEDARDLLADLERAFLESSRKEETADCLA